MKNYFYRGAWAEMRSTSLSVGFLLSLSFVLFAFKYTTNPRPFVMPDGPEWEEGEVYITPAIPTAPTYAPPVKIHEPKAKEPLIPDDFIIDDSDDGFLDDHETFEDPVFENQVFSNGSSNQKAAPMVAPITPTKDEEILIRAQQMPLFGDCSDIVDKGQRDLCSTKAILSFIRDNIKYPEIAKEIGLTGKVVAKFVISKTGEVTDIEILRDLGAGTGTEVLRVLNKMPNWKPGKQNMRPVRVQMIVPVKFDLQ